MSNKYTSPFGNMDFTDMQKQFMDALMNFSQGQSAVGSPGNNFSGTNWADAMDFWWKTFKPQTGPQSDNIFNKMLEQCRTYYALSEQFAKLYEGMQNAKQGSDDFVHFLNDQMQNMETVMADNHQLFSWTNFIDQCEQPVELLKNLLSSSPLYTGEVINEFSPELKKLREKFLTIPGLGYSRETQEKIQEALHLWAQYQDKYQEFHAVMSRLNHDAMDLMRKRLLKMHKEGENVESMRQIYHIWVESNEQVYADFVFTEEYSELNAELVNSLMAFKNKSHEITEDYLSAMNLPTSSAIDALERRQYELRKQVRNIESELKSVKQEMGQKQEALVQKKASAVSSEKAATDTASPAAKEQKKTSASAKKKGASKRKRKAKKAEAKKSSQIVDFKKSQLEKQKKLKTNAKKADTAPADSSDVDTKRMIEIKF